MKIKKLFQWKKQMSSIVLDSAKKIEVQNNVVAYMKLHPVRIETSPRHKDQTRGNMFSFLTQKSMFATLAVILTLMVGSGTAFAAENSVPGDSLYPVKVHVNEQVRGALALNSEAKADWETRKAERRLEEAATLSAQGNLSPEVEAQLQDRFEEHTTKIKDRIAELQADGNVEAAANLSSRLESALQIHENILLKINSEEGTTKKEVKPLLKELKDEVKDINHIRTQIDDDIEARVGTDAKVAAENRMNASLNHIENIREYLEDTDVSATSSAMLKLAAAEKLHAEGKTELDAENYGKAFILFGSAQRLAQKAKIMVHVRTNVELNSQADKIFDRFEEEEIEIDEDEDEDIEDHLDKRREDRQDKEDNDEDENERNNKFEDRVKKVREHRRELKQDTSGTLDTVNEVL